MIRAVIFDMFETLVTHFESPLYFGAQMAADAGIGEADFQAVWRPAEDDRTLGRLTLEELLERVLKENRCYSEELLQKLASKRKATKEDCFRHLHGEILPMLAALKARGIKIGLITNCFSEEAEVIRGSVLMPFFDAALLSNEQGVKKPDPEIFVRCMEQLNAAPGECIYVGDGGSRELEAARDLGMNPVQAVWYLKEGSLQPAGKMPEFAQAMTPLEVLEYVDLYDANQNGIGEKNAGEKSGNESAAEEYGSSKSEGAKEAKCVQMCQEVADRIERVAQMESILDEVLHAVENCPNAVREDVALNEKIDTLLHYYEGGLWLQDYEADEAGLLPRDLKRGVLAQDTLYDLLYDVDQLRRQH